MANGKPTSPLVFTALFVCIVVVSLFVRLLPLGHGSDPWPMPNLLVCLTFAWVLRRPDYLPALVIGAVFFAEDLLLLRPPGLWALLVLLGSEFLRRRGAGLRGVTIVLEVAVVSAVLLAMTVAYRVILAIVMVPQAPLGLSLGQFIGTVVAYPVVVMISHYVFNVRKPATGEVDAIGRRV